MFPAGPVSLGVSSFPLRLHRPVAKNSLIIIRVLLARLIRPARGLPTGVPLRPVPRVRLVRPVRMVRHRVRPVLVALVALAARGELNAREGFPVLVARPVPVARGVVPVARPVRVALAAAPVVLVAALPVLA